MHSGSFPCLLPVFDETLDVSYGPRAHVHHAAKSTISDHFDPLIQISLQLRHTTAVRDGSPLKSTPFY